MDPAVRTRLRSRQFSWLRSRLRGLLYRELSWRFGCCRGTLRKAHLMLYRSLSSSISALALSVSIFSWNFLAW